MMSLLSVTVKKARYVGIQDREVSYQPPSSSSKFSSPSASQFNTYATLKLQNVKSTTVTVKGATPCWEQDFLFEINDLNTGLLIEVWNKGMLWDRALGYHWIRLQTVQYSNEEGCGHWLSLDGELVMRDAEVIGTKAPTGHSLLVDCRFELPFDPENIEAGDLQRKLEMLNNIMDQEARAEQARRQMQYFGHSGYSEDSDYTSDLNYPVGQHANSSASQFRSAAHQIHTPQRSLETSRENSYERDDGIGHLMPQPHPTTHQQHLSPNSYRQKKYLSGQEDFGYGSQNTATTRLYQDNNIDTEPLSYNSRPRNKTEYSGRRRNYSWGNNDSQDVWENYDNYNYNKQNIERADTGYSFESEYFDAQSFDKTKGGRRPSLERQSTLYDDVSFYSEQLYYAPPKETTEVAYVQTRAQSFNKSYDEFFDASSYSFQDERYGQDQEDRQWDSGGFPNNKAGKKKLPAIPVVQKRRSSYIHDDTSSYNCTPTPTARRRMPQIPTKRSASRQSSINDDGYRTPENSRGASLPPTPTKAPKMLNRLPQTPGRQLPKPILSRSAKARRNNLMKRTSSADYTENDNLDYYCRPGAMSATQIYNEDYNYAYQSTDNLLPTEEMVVVQQQQQQQEVQLHNDGLNSVNINNVNNFRNDSYQYSSEEYYYSPPEDKDAYRDEYESDVRRKKLGDTSPFYQTNTDSLESKDDELKDSFDTALSSLSSVPKIQPLMPNHIDNTPKITTTTITSQYHRDQVDAPKAIYNTAPMVTPPILQINNTPVINRKLFKQQETMDVSYYPPDDNSGYMSGSNEFTDKDDPYLEQQESIESFTEEGTITNGESIDYNKAISHESPVSVIHVDSYEEDHELRRGSSQITVVDPYHTKRPSDAYAVPSSRRTSVDPYRPPSPRRPSLDAYQDELLDEDYLSSPQRKPSVIDVYQSGVTRKPSVRHSPVLHNQETVDIVIPADTESPEKKNVSFEEEEETKQARPTITAKQRWHWAYNKIIMQLNVSFFPHDYFCITSG